MSVARSNPAAMRQRARYGFLAALLVLAAAVITPASAQQISSGVLAVGNAAVSGFSGATPPVQIPPGVDPAEKTFIDPDGPSLRIVDLQHMGGPPAAQLVAASKPVTWFAAQIGQVFAVALDDANPPNIYAAATSAYGLPIVAPGPRRGRACPRNGAPHATFMPGLWGARAGGGPGSIWKIDGATGAVSLFANVKLDGGANSGPALGGLAFDPDPHSLYVADRETGFIHRFGTDGAERDRFDHGMAGRASTGPAAGRLRSGVGARHHQRQIRQRRSGDLELCRAGAARLRPRRLPAPPLLRGRRGLADLVGRALPGRLVRHRRDA